jgi:hypothetical protein
MKRKTDLQADEPVAQPPAAIAEDGWLQRWSQRKSRSGAALEPDNAVVTGQPDAAPVTGEAGGDAAKDEAGEADEPALPPIESLDEHSDYRGFLSEKVSEDLRLQALRKLFSLPQFNVRDGLNDYDEDFASFKPLGDLVPHDMARSFERALKKAAGPDNRGEAAKSETTEPDRPVPDVVQAAHSRGEDSVPVGLDDSSDAQSKG